MSEFIVPKFIEHKAKVIGPLTFQQFIYVGIAGALAFVFYYTLPFHLFFILGTIVMIFGAGLAFGNINGRPIPLMFKNFVFFVVGPKIYLWNKKTGLPPKMTTETTANPALKKPGVIEPTTELSKNRESRLSNLAKQIEIK